MSVRSTLFTAFRQLEQGVAAAVRELIGSGTLLGFPVLGSNYPGVLLFILAPGGYITLGLVMVAFNAVMKKIDGRRRAAAEGSVA